MLVLAPISTIQTLLEVHQHYLQDDYIKCHFLMCHQNQVVFVCRLSRLSINHYVMLNFINFQPSITNYCSIIALDRHHLLII